MYRQTKFSILKTRCSPIPDYQIINCIFILLHRMRQIDNINPYRILLKLLIGRRNRQRKISIIIIRAYPKRFMDYWFLLHLSSYKSKNYQVRFGLGRQSFYFVLIQCNQYYFQGFGFQKRSDTKFFCKYSTEKLYQYSVVQNISLNYK